jgi:hypothetical protein
MTHPTHGLDPNALEAAPARSRLRLHHDLETTAKALFDRARRLDQVAGFGYEMADFLTDLVPFLYALSQNPGTSNTSGEAVGAQKLLGSDDDPESLAYALRIGAMGTPFNDYQGALYMNSRYKADEYRDAEFHDYGLARAVRIILNNADAIRNILATLEPRASDREAVTDEMVRAGAFAAWASTTPFAGLTEAAFRAKSDQHVRSADLGGGTTLEQDMLLDWELNTDTFCVLARATLEAAIRKLSEVSHEH